MKALREYQQKLIEFNVSIYVRRGGPNYQEGLRVMRELGKAAEIQLTNGGSFSLMWFGFLRYLVERRPMSFYKRRIKQKIKMVSL